MAHTCIFPIHQPLDLKLNLLSSCCNLCKSGHQPGDAASTCHVKARRQGQGSSMMVKRGWNFLSTHVNLPTRTDRSSTAQLLGTHIGMSHPLVPAKWFYYRNVFLCLMTYRYRMNPLPYLTLMLPPRAQNGECFDGSTGTIYGITLSSSRKLCGKERRFNQSNLS